MRGHSLPRKMVEEGVRGREGEGGRDGVREGRKEERAIEGEGRERVLILCL